MLANAGLSPESVEQEMNLPNYFLADLPPEAALSPTTVVEACQSLKRNREKFLAGRSTQSMVALLGAVAKEWLRPEFHLRRAVLEQGPAATGFSRATLAAGLDAFFCELTPENFQALLEQDLGHAERLDELSASESERRGNRSSLATAPALLAHIAAGNLPNPALTSMVLGVLLRSAQFVKCASGAALLPRLFAHSLYEADAKLGACIEVAHWPGGSLPLEDALFAEADCVTATGSDETLAAIRKRVPAHTRFAGYGHRLSFGYIASEVLTGPGVRAVAVRAAADVAAWNQLGCLSPQVLYVQDGGTVSPELFAQLVAEELAARETAEPRGELPAATAAAIASRRSIHELRAAHSPETRCWCSEGSTAWTVIYEADPRFQRSCLNRFVYVKGVSGLAEALRSADSERGRVSSVGLAAGPQQARGLATELARWGVTRVCPLGRMQCPALTWRHDGRPALAELVQWTDWERGN